MNQIKLKSIITNVELNVVNGNKNDKLQFFSFERRKRFMIKKKEKELI